MRGWEASTSLPLMKMVTLRVLDFAMTDVFAKMVQMSVTGYIKIRTHYAYVLKMSSYAT